MPFGWYSYSSRVPLASCRHLSLPREQVAISRLPLGDPESHIATKEPLGQVSGVCREWGLNGISCACRAETSKALDCSPLQPRLGFSSASLPLGYVSFKCIYYHLDTKHNMAETGQWNLEFIVRKIK